MTDDTTEAAVAVAASLVLPITVGVAAGWPTWVIALVAVVLSAVSVVAVGQRRQRREQRELRAAELRHQARHAVPPEPEPVRALDRPLTAVSLPSALSDYRFTFACTVHWQSHPNAVDHAEPAAVATDAVVQRALRFTAGRRPEDEGAAHALAAVLGQRENDPSRRVVAWATDVRLELEPDDRDRLRRVADMRKQQQVWEQEVAAERAVRAYLGQDVLATTGSTVVWWLARNTGQVREAVDLISTFARLSAAAGDREVDELFRRSPVDGPPAASFTVNGHGIVTEDVPAPHDDVLLDPDDHPVFGHQLAALLEQHEAPDRAQRARERYGVSEWNSDDEPPESARGDV
ncbi:hypothetical protein [Saccharothrix sp. HUAS TT1]|uniref:hypothetical protein n=1 Tax=unclassified Saccharothrix TaxID=2593673 RepID=UPI00345BB0B0